MTDQGPDGEPLEFPADGRPQFLAGTFNKVLDYESGVYAEQHFRFNERMRAIDRPRRQRLRLRRQGRQEPPDRLARAPAREPNASHPPRPRGLHAGARAAIQRYWKRAADSGQLAPVDKGFEEVDWPAIKNRL